jgi:hypothetical protein
MTGHTTVFKQVKRSLRIPIIHGSNIILTADESFFDVFLLNMSLKNILSKTSAHSAPD